MFFFIFFINVRALFLVVLKINCFNDIRVFKGDKSRAFSIITLDYHNQSNNYIINRIYTSLCHKFILWAAAPVFFFAARHQSAVFFLMEISKNENGLGNFLMTRHLTLWFEMSVDIDIYIFFFKNIFYHYSHVTKQEVVNKIKRGKFVLYVHISLSQGRLLHVLFEVVSCYLVI